MLGAYAQHTTEQPNTRPSRRDARRISASPL